MLKALELYPECPGNTGLEQTWIPKTIVVNPVFEMSSHACPAEVSVVNIDTGCNAFCRIGDGEFVRYNGPFVVDSPCVLEAYSENLNGTKSFIVRSEIKDQP